MRPSVTPILVPSKNPNEADSCSFSIVVTQETPKPPSAIDAAGLRKLRGFWQDDCVLQSLMISLRATMQSEFTHSTAQRDFPEEDHSLHAGFFDTANEPFRVSVQIWASCGKSQRLDSRAIRSTRSRMSTLSGGRPGLRLVLESHFLAVKRRCQARRVSGVTMLANRARPFRTIGFPLAARRRR